MSKRFPLLILAFAAAFSAVTPANSQTLQVQVTAGGATTNIAANGSQSLTSPGVGLAVFTNVTVTNIGSATVTVNSVSLTGTSAMTLSSTAGATLSPNGSLVFSVEYLPTTGAAATGQIVINYTVSGAASAFQFNLIGITPSFTFSY